MTMTDPIADMLTRIRNALKVRHEYVDIPGSKMKLRITEILKSEGYIKDFQVLEDGPKRTIRIFLKYDEKKQPVIEGLKRVSKPGRRVYAGYKEIPKVLNGYGINIVSTSQGIMTDREARRKKLGGEIICSVW